MIKMSSVVQEIADVIGRDRALYLVGKLPRIYVGPNSTRERVLLYVPTRQRLTRTHTLVGILGWEDAYKLCCAFGGEILDPGTCAEVYRRFRDDAIARMAASGARNVDIAAWLGVTDRHVRNVVREKPQEELKAANDNNQRTILKVRKHGSKR